MKDRSDDPLHHEQTLLPQSYILPLEMEKKPNFMAYYFQLPTSNLLYAPWLSI